MTEYIPLHEAAELSGFTKGALQGAIYRGDLEARQISRVWFTTTENIEAFKRTKASNLSKRSTRAGATKRALLEAGRANKSDEVLDLLRALDRKMDLILDHLHPEVWETPKEDLPQVLPIFKGVGM